MLPRSRRVKIQRLCSYSSSPAKTTRIQTRIVGGRQNFSRTLVLHRFHPKVIWLSADESLPHELRTHLTHHSRSVSCRQWVTLASQHFRTNPQESIHEVLNLPRLSILPRKREGKNLLVATQRVVPTAVKRRRYEKCDTSQYRVTLAQVERGERWILPFFQANHSPKITNSCYAQPKLHSCHAQG